ncbi:MAG: hypothetical protein EBV32_04805, partial [Proteobacteria bacterium]|nr:hypothetical protein [Candidatus Fonsibacter lacus]
LRVRVDREGRTDGADVHEHPALEVYQVAGVVGTGGQVVGDLRQRTAADVLIALIRHEDTPILGDGVQPLEAEVVQDLPALDAHVHAGGKVPLTVPVLGDKVVNDDPVAVSGVIQR